MSALVVGCAGYSYDDWAGSFYPEGLPKSQRLEYYASRFSFVELNFSYYAMPRRDRLAQMRARVPEDFRFSIKAHSSLTHERGPEWQEHAAAFTDALSGLEGVLAGVLLQFPYSFHYTPENRQYLADLSDALGDAELYVEFRNKEWERPSVLEGMEQRRLNRVLVDAPSLDDLPTTFSGRESLPTQSAYLRLHGRRADTWWSGTNVTRYAYDYSRQEIAEIGTGIQKLQAPKLFVVFNNHANARAPLNALDLLEFVEVE